MSLRVLLVGCGGISRRGHGPALRRYAAAHLDVELAACADLDAGIAGLFAERFGFRRSYGDLEEALRREQPDAIVLAVPAPLVAKVAIGLLERGYPVLMEKPPGLSRTETLGIVRAASREDGSSVPNQVAFNRRFMPLSRRVREWSGARRREGGLHHVQYDIYRVGRTDSEDASVTLIHGIDAIRYWAGSDYRTVRIAYRPLAHLGGNVVNVSLAGELEGGVTFALNYFPVSGAVMERAVLMSEDETLLARLPFWTSGDSPGEAERYRGNERIERWLGDEDGAEDDIVNGFYAENASFLDHLRAGTRPEHDAASAVQSVELAEAVLRRESRFGRREEGEEAR
ncbi:Gfo/Idh/MocA family protein [Cohnella sp. AR92]|uniref:Gfo/Idh/MocA family protein n=1 Tax=Cohnella sp. AR92 TaxID=648716 RepID=UPI0013156929|nr:Gfo/Idh/MocA family oxidoreductase [Cohnella sp. AR92]